MSDELPQEEARINAAAEVLAKRLQSALAIRQLDRSSYQIALTIIADHRTQARQNGLNFPPVAVLPFPRRGFMKILHAELSRSDIEKAIVNLTVEIPNVTAQEIAMAVHFGFPHYRGDSVKVH